MYIIVSHTNGRSIKDTIGVVTNRLGGMGLYLFYVTVQRAGSGAYSYALYICVLIGLLCTEGGFRHSLAPESAIHSPTGTAQRRFLLQESRTCRVLLGELSIGHNLLQKVVHETKICHATIQHATTGTYPYALFTCADWFIVHNRQ